MSDKPKHDRYVSVDIETTGLDEENCQILELGAVIDDWTTPIADLPVFHCYIKHDQIKGEAYALSMHPVILERIAKGSCFNTYKPGEVGQLFAKWLFENKVEPTSVVAAGKNFAAFDLQFLKRLGDWMDGQFKNDVKFKHRVIDPGSMYMLPGETEPPNTKTCMERAGIAGEVAHTAVEDARVVVQLVRIAMARKAYCLKLEEEEKASEYTRSIPHEPENVFLSPQDRDLMVEITRLPG